MEKIKIGLLTEINNRHNDVIPALEELEISYDIIDFTSEGWWRNITKSDCDGFIIRASGEKETSRQLCEERLYHIVKDTNIPLYPSYAAIRLYENKKAQAYWMEINKIIHPKTYIFYKKTEAVSFLNSCTFPIVFKPNLGAKAMGVKIIKNKTEGMRIINKLFTRYKFINFGYTSWTKKRGIPIPIMDNKQYNFLMFQEFIAVKTEWRIIKVGNSYFGHQKLANEKGFHSGSGLVGWVLPPIELLELLKTICIKGNFHQMSIDVFEDSNGNYYVNEMQTYWGGKKESQMLDNGIGCRYIDDNGIWRLEYGIFNQNRSWNLRVNDFMKTLRQPERSQNI
jgi:glutathione synthase/RimK-type ligase-like ATP-grasp enzyme